MWDRVYKNKMLIKSTAKDKKCVLVLPAGW